MGYLIDVLRGRLTTRLKASPHHKLSVFAIGKEYIPKGNANEVLLMS